MDQIFDKENHDNLIQRKTPKFRKGLTKTNIKKTQLPSPRISTLSKENLLNQHLSEALKTQENLRQKLEVATNEIKEKEKIITHLEFSTTLEKVKTQPNRVRKIMDLSVQNSDLREELATRDLIIANRDSRIVEMMKRIPDWNDDFLFYRNQSLDSLEWKIVNEKCKSSRMKSLHLEGCSIDDSQLQELLRNLTLNSYVTELYLNSNEITEKSVVSLQNLLKRNQNIEILDLSNNYLNSESINRILDILSLNNGISILNLQGNPHSLKKIPNINVRGNTKISL